MGIMSDVDRRWSVCDSCGMGIMSDVDRSVTWALCQT